MTSQPGLQIITKQIQQDNEIWSVKFDITKEIFFFKNYAENETG